MSDDDAEVTSIQVTKPTRKRLKLWKTEQEMTYDQAINELLDEQERDTDE